MINVSIIVCAYKRSDCLDKTLHSLITQEFPPSEFEIIVVDNNSAGEMQRIVDSARKESLVRICFVREKRQGLSHARNAGIKEAKGRIVAFLDDDAITDKRWVKGIVSTFEEVKPIPGCIGGKVLPSWKSQRPAWLSGPLLSYLSILDLGERPRWLKENEFLCGTNMAILKRSLEEISFFEPRLGRKEDSLISNEENLLFYKLRQRRKNIYYQPALVVNHIIHEERLTRRWFFRRIFAQGISDYRLKTLGACNLSQSSHTSPFYFIATSFVRTVSAMFDITFGSTQKRYSAFSYLITILGYVYALLHDKIKPSYESR